MMILPRQSIWIGLSLCQAKCILCIYAFFFLFSFLPSICMYANIPVTPCLPMMCRFDLMKNPMYGKVNHDP